MLRPKLMDLARCLMLKLIGFGCLSEISCTTVSIVSDKLQCFRLPIYLSYRLYRYRLPIKRLFYRMRLSYLSSLPRLGDPLSLVLIGLLTHYAEGCTVEVITFQPGYDREYQHRVKSLVESLQRSAVAQRCFYRVSTRRFTRSD